MGKYLFIWMIGLSIYNQCIGQAIPKDLPIPGQRISYVSYTEQGKLDLEADGNDVTWDFSYLQAPYQKEVSIESSTNGKNASQFVSADLVLKEANGYEVYLQQSGDNLIEVGRTGGFWLLDDIDHLIKYNVKPIIRKAGITYGKRYSDRSSFSIEWGKKDLLRLNATGIPAAYDSIRYDISVIKEISADGNGQLVLPMNIYNVLRLKHEVEITITPYVKTNLGWQKYNIRIDRGLPLKVPVGIYHFDRYEYWSDDEALPVMYIDHINDEYSIRYLVADNSIPKIKVYNQNRDILAFPNPTYGEIEIQLINLPQGKYKLEIDNIFGQPMHTQTFDVNHTRKIKTDLSFLSRGTYLYSIIDEKGNKIATKRVVIITP